MKILVLTQTRSGTHLLLGALDQFIPFLHFDQQAAFIPGALSVKVREFFNEYSSSETLLVHNHLIEVEPKTDDWVKSWHELRSLFDRVLVITRKNRIKQFLSKVISEFRDATYGVTLNHWNCRERRPTDPTVILDFEHYKYFKLHLQVSTLQILNLVYPYYPITYDDLVIDWVPTMQRVYQYLGLPWNDPKPTTFRQEYRTIDQIISNWTDLPAEQKLQLQLDDQGV